MIKHGPQRQPNRTTFVAYSPHVSIRDPSADLARLLSLRPMSSSPCRTWSLALPLLAALTVPAVASASADHVMELEPDATEPSSEAAATGEAEESSGWGPIVGACLGILFGGGLALWQIRGMKGRD